MHARTVACRAIAAIALAMSLPLIAAAQSAASSESRLPPGTKIRFELRDGVRHEGSVVALSADTLRATWLGASETAFHVSDVQKLEVMSGRRRSVTKSLLIGTGAGVVLGTAIGAMTHEPCDAEGIGDCLLEPENRSQSAALGGLGGAVLGLVVGGVVGLVPRDRWERVRLDGRVARLGTRTLPHGAQGVGFAVAF
jgi:hypothetical protein